MQGRPGLRLAVLLLFVALQGIVMAHDAAHAGQAASAECPLCVAGHEPDPAAMGRPVPAPDHEVHPTPAGPALVLARTSIAGALARAPPPCRPN